MADNRNRKIVGYDPYTGAPIYSNPSGGGKGVIKGILIGLIVVVIGAAGWLVYDNFFNLTEVDLFAGIDELYLDGYSGEGVLYSDNFYYSGEWVGEPQYMSAFYDSIYYEADTYEGLSNGDTVTVTAYYDSAAARKCKVKVKSDTKTFEVSGLRERFKSDGSDIPAADLAAIRQYMDDYVAREITDDDSYKNEGLVKMLYISPTVSDGYDNYEDMMVGVYKISYKGWWDDEYETEYISVWIYPLDKSFNYAENIDQLMYDGDLSIYNDWHGDDLGSAIDSIKTQYNRDTVTELPI